MGSQSFGVRLRRLRSERGLRQIDLVGDKISASYISLLEADRRVPSARVIQHLSERLQCSLEELQVPTVQAAARAAGVELKMARAALLIRQIDKAEAWYQRMIVEHDGDRTSQEAEFGLARAAEMDGRYAEAAERYQRCQAGANDPEYAHRLSVTLGLVRSLARAGDTQHAITAALQAKQLISDALLDRSDLAVEIRAILATVLCERSDYANAEQPIAEALEIVPQISDRAALSEVYWQASLDAYRNGRPGHALELVSRITDVDTTDYGHTLSMLQAVYGSVLLRRSPPDPDKAREVLELALTNLTDQGAVADAVRCRSDLVRAWIMLKDYRKALQLTDEMLAPSEVPPAERIRARLLRATAQSLLGDDAAAITECGAARTELEQQPHSAQTSQLWSLLAEALRQAGDSDGAIHAYRCAVNGLGIDMPPTLLPVAMLRATAQADA